jgi:hypothetical protein
MLPIKPFLKILPGLLAVFFALALLNSCNSVKVDVQKERAAFLLTQPVLVLMPISPLPNSVRLCDSMGAYFSVEVPKRIKGSVVYSQTVPGLKDLSTWANLVKNGEINVNEAASMAKTIGCQSVITVQILEFKLYPPFKTVLIMHWIDADTGNVIGKVYNDVDVGDTQVNYRYRCFSGQGPLKEVYEEFSYSEDLFQTANLSPEKFKLFAAAFTANVMFKTAEDADWRWWRVL